MAAGPRALRRAARAARLRRPRRRRHPRDRLAAARAQPRRPSRGRPRDRPLCDRGRGRRSREGRPSGDVRRGARRLPRRDAARAPAPDRPRHRDGPTGRARRGHRHPAVPARRPAVRGLLPAGPLRSVTGRDLRGDAGRGRRPRRDARALSGLDQQHQHPRGVPRAPPPARAGGAPSVAHPRPGLRPRVRRGLGDVQRADDARAGLRRRPGLPPRARHRRDLASGADRPRHPDAPRRGLDRRGGGLPDRAHRLRAPERPRRGAALHVHADLQPVVPARQGAAPGAPRRRASPARRRVLAAGLPRCAPRGGSLPVSFHRRALHGEGVSPAAGPA